MPTAANAGPETSFVLTISDGAGSEPFYLTPDSRIACIATFTNRSLNVLENCILTLFFSRGVEIQNATIRVYDNNTKDETYSHVSQHSQISLGTIKAGETWHISYTLIFSENPVKLGEQYFSCKCHMKFETILLEQYGRLTFHIETALKGLPLYYMEGAIYKSSDSMTVYPDKKVFYELVIMNVGNVKMQSIEIQDQQTEHISYNRESAKAYQWKEALAVAENYDPKEHTLTFLLDGLAFCPGDVITVPYLVTVTSDSDLLLQLEQIEDVVEMEYSSEQVGRSLARPGWFFSIPVRFSDITLEKKAFTYKKGIDSQWNEEEIPAWSAIKPDTTFSYKITLTNAGNADAIVNITDAFPEQFKILYAMLPTCPGITKQIKAPLPGLVEAITCDNIQKRSDKTDQVITLHHIDVPARAGDVNGQTEVIIMGYAGDVG